MSLITRCPSCATKFKVTPEQLRVSEGWVRCGRCNNIFDATDHLLEGQIPPPADEQSGSTVPASNLDNSTTPSSDGADHERPSERWLKELSETFSPTATPSDGSSQSDALVHAAQAEAQEPTTDIGPEIEPADDANATPSENAPDDLGSFQDELERWQAKQSATPAQPSHVPATEDASTDVTQSIGGQDHTDQQESLAASLKRPSVESAPTAAPEPESTLAPAQAAPLDSAQHTEGELPLANEAELAPYEPVPQDSDGMVGYPTQEQLDEYNAAFSETQELRFIREAEQKAFWRRPAIRALMGLLALLLLALLTAQYTYYQRDSIAAISPQWKARMQTACNALGCTITPLQALEDLVLDGSTFQSEGNNRYTLSWSVRNRSSQWIQTPALSLSLRDENGKTLIRRTIEASEINQVPLELAPGTAWKAEKSLVLNTYADAITGYQLQIFYPNTP
ncbi:DUF3426 domain-containing protein [Lampropedia puyangensis]|uniref:DUF3426 domain-containing protein n=1 Tax=Lampropedia puyangensis TaxID=1330072 RepID=A0A4S8F491_9BURK|nr:zinc-ribbon and DUF3426 domain-containing protein [Lampropedia puyangensis]THU01561.1 DUF3426 domain-containing protein [Lampropedia puyangensis]